ncbi:LCP family protein [Streptomyces tsukubensis]|uniref:LCP family protein n=1 Tax=Streptomyces tsukubensis TaxID=83656 RepID=UPI0036E52A09
MTESAGTPTGPDGPDGGDGGDDAVGERTGGGAEHHVPPPLAPEDTPGPDAQTDTGREADTGPGAGADSDPGPTPGPDSGTDAGTGTGTDSGTGADPADVTVPPSGSDADADADAVAERIPHAAPDGDSAPAPGGAPAAAGHLGAPLGVAPDGPAADPEGPRRKRRWLRWTALGVSVVLLSGSATAWWFYRKLDGNITTDTATAVELETFEKERPVQVSLDAKNILLMGSDTRRGEGNSKYGRDDGGSQRADTVILLHIAADRQSSTSMSIPRDLMTTIPSCRRPDGSRTEERLGQFNSAFETGGAACAIRTVEKMTGVRIDHHMVVDFRGFTKMVDAVDGVEVCLKEPVDDPDAHLDLPEGRQTLDGEQALGYVRARKSIGNGSDTERMDRQQQFLGSLVKKVQSDGVLLNPGKLYPVLDAATKSLTTDPGLDSLKDLYDLTRSLRNVPTENVQFLTVPRRPWANDRNRDELVQPQASVLFRQLREDSPITVLTPGAKAAADANANAAQKNAPSPGAVRSADPRENERTDSAGKPSRPPSGSPGASASPTNSPSFSGTNAAVGVCD